VAGRRGRRNNKTIVEEHCLLNESLTAVVIVGSSGIHLLMKALMLWLELNKSGASFDDVCRLIELDAMAGWRLVLVFATFLESSE